MSSLAKTIAAIAPVNTTLIPDIEAHLNDLTKPQGSLGRLEELALRYCLATDTAKPEIGLKRIYTFAADHGVADEGVSAFPREVTPQMVYNIVAGGAAVNALARHAGAEVVCVDVGVADPLDGAEGLVRRKVRAGTRNMAVGPAMTVDEATQAIEVGIACAHEAADAGATLIGTGEMGIANTTPATALYAALLGLDVESITGRGTGIDDERLAHKTAVIKRSLDTNSEHLGEPITALAAVGGLEIAAIAGLILGAAERHLLVAVDGFISTAGALVAMKLAPAIAGYVVYSHQSDERGHTTALKEMGATPILHLGMRLGEGTGAALAISLIEASIRVYNEMATFSSAGVSGSTD
jgi:nicotinate-nucleotide--dimethylbenzimidazole phosphoribosyltransferase